MGIDSYDNKRVPVSQRLMSREAQLATDGQMISLELDGHKIDVEPGTTILDAASKVGVHIPTLCTHPDLCVVGNCRVCVVEVEGKDALQAACAYPITESIVVRTHSSQIRLARRHIIELILAHHEGDCFACSRSQNCELSALASEFGVDSIQFEPNATKRTVDKSSIALMRDMNKCVLCRRCVRACIDMQEVGVMEAVGKGDAIEIQTFSNKPLKDVVCIGCGQCVSRCPTAALTYADDTQHVWNALDDANKHVVIQLSPSVRASIAETFGMAPGTLICEKLIGQLHTMGFANVFDSQIAVGLAIVEQARQIIANICSKDVQKKHSQRVVFSSNSSGWVKYMEHFIPSYLQYLSPLKGAEQLLGTLVRTHYASRFGIDEGSIVSVAAVPCAAKKVEATNSLSFTKNARNVDYCITTRELGKMLRESGVQLDQMENHSFDSLIASGEISTFLPFNSMLHMLAGVLYQLLTGNELKPTVPIAYTSPFGIPGAYIMTVPIDKVVTHKTHLWEDDFDYGLIEGRPLVLGKCEGTANAKRVIEDIERGGVFSGCHYIEFLACPDGCFGGGGQPVPTNSRIRQSRKEAFPTKIKFPKPQFRYLESLYQRCIANELGGNFKREDLFTSYTPRGKFIK